MKKFLTLVIALLLSIGVSAQTQLTEAVNFTSTAHNGEEIELFDILDGGQYALIYFYYSTGPTQTKDYVTRLVDAYYSLGCNEGDIYFMEVSEVDHKKSTDEWIATYGIPFPSIHTETEGDTGNTIVEKYQIKGWPTTVLIAPDRTIVDQDIYPIETAEALVETLTSTYDIEENYCGNQTPEVAITKTKVNMEDGQGNVLEASTKVHVDFRANAAVDKFYYTISESKELTSEDVIENGTLAENKEFSHTFEGLKESTTYFVYAQAVSHDGENGAKSVIETRTLCPGDAGEVQIELSVEVTAAFVVANATPNESTSEYHFGFVKKDYYNASAENQFTYLYSLVNDGYIACGPDRYEVPIKNEETGAPRFEYNTPYYIVAVGRNGEGEWFTPTLEEFMIEVASGPAKVDLTVNALSTRISVSAVPNDFAVEFYYGVVTKEAYDKVGVDSLIKEIRITEPFYQATQSTYENDIKPNTEYVALGSAKNANGEWGETTEVSFTTMPEALTELESNFNIYPNPAHSMINIESSLKGEAQVNIFDMTGRNVKEVSVSDMSNVSINVEDLNKGVYFISIQQDNNHNIQKLVIE